LTNAPAALPRAGAEPRHCVARQPNDFGQYLNIANYDGNSTQVTSRSELEGAGFIGRCSDETRRQKHFLRRAELSCGPR